MTESLRRDAIDAAIENSIESKLEKILKLENDELHILRTDRQNQRTKSAAVDEMEISLTNELSMLTDAGATLRSEIDDAWKLVCEKREEIERTKFARQDNEEQRLEDLISFENALSKGLPKFRDALRLYSEDFLKKEIEEIRDEGREIEHKIFNVDQEIKALVSKYNLDELKTIEISGNGGTLTELQELKTIWINSNSNRFLAKKQIEYLNQVLGEKVKLNKRKIAKLL